MDGKSVQLGWKWDELENTGGWEIPDEAIMRLAVSVRRDQGVKVYDLGCGIGRHTVFFASQGFQVSASDISESAVRKTREWLIKAGLTADVQQGRMTEIKQRGNSFDLVISINVIYHAFKKDIIRTISEVLRILKPGGLFYGTLKTKDRTTPFTGENCKIVDEQTIIIKEGIEEGIPHFFTYREDLVEFFKDFEFDHVTYAELYESPNVLDNLLTRKGASYFRFAVRKPK